MIAPHTSGWTPEDDALPIVGMLGRFTLACVALTSECVVARPDYMMVNPKRVRAFVPLRNQDDALWLFTWGGRCGFYLASEWGDPKCDGGEQ